MFFAGPCEVMVIMPTENDFYKRRGLRMIGIILGWIVFVIILIALTIMWNSEKRPPGWDYVRPFDLSPFISVYLMGKF